MPCETVFLYDIGYCLTMAAGLFMSQILQNQ